MKRYSTHSRCTAAIALALLAMGCSHPTSTSESEDIPDYPGPDIEVNFPVHHQRPAWSANDMIAYEDAGIVCVDKWGYYWTDANLKGLWVLDLRARTKTRISSTALHPDWSPDGSRLALSDEGMIVTVNPDGSGRSQLTEAGRNYLPRWSASGEQIVFMSDRGYGFRVWMINSDGSEIHEVLRAPAIVPSWHPSGRILAYIAAPPGVTDAEEIYTLDLPSGPQTRLTWDGSIKDHPNYSPDGTRIAYMFQYNGPPEVWIANADGSGARRLTFGGGLYPEWSPDGKRIVYTKYDWMNNDPQNGVLWILDVETGEELQLTTKWPSECP